MPNIPSQLVMRPVRPNSTISASATTNGGVISGSTVMAFNTPA